MAGADGLVIYAGNSNPPLAQAVCSAAGMKPGCALVGRFSDGEIRIEIRENVRGMDVFVLQSTCPPVNENLIELLVLVDALKRASARRITAVVPYFGYGRQDQKERPRVSIAAKVVADLFLVAGCHRVMTLDLHAEQIEGFFSIPVDHLFGMEVLLEDVRKSLRGDEVIVAPDAGGVERARDFASRLRVDLAMLDYRRSHLAPHWQIVGNVRGRRVVILDDMVDTGRTLIRSAEGARDAGADVVDAYCVHAVLSGQAVQQLKASPLRSLVTTDTVPLSPEAQASGLIRTVSVAPMLAECIRRVHRDESVSSYFAKR